MSRKIGHRSRSGGSKKDNALSRRFQGSGPMDSERQEGQTSSLVDGPSGSASVFNSSEWLQFSPPSSARALCTSSEETCNLIPWSAVFIPQSTPLRYSSGITDTIPSASRTDRATSADARSGKFSMVSIRLSVRRSGISFTMWGSPREFCAAFDRSEPHPADDVAAWTNESPVNAEPALG